MYEFKNTKRFKKGKIAEELFDEIFSEITHFNGMKYYSVGIGNKDESHPIDGFITSHNDEEPIVFELKARERLGKCPELSYTYAEYMQYKKYDKLLIINFSGISGLVHGCHFSELTAPFKCELAGKEYPCCIDNYTRRTFKLSYLNEYAKTNDTRGIEIKCLVCKASNIYYKLNKDQRQRLLRHSSMTDKTKNDIKELYGDLFYRKLLKDDEKTKCCALGCTITTTLP